MVNSDAPLVGASSVNCLEMVSVRRFFLKFFFYGISVLQKKGGPDPLEPPLDPPLYVMLSILLSILVYANITNSNAW